MFFIHSQFAIVTVSPYNISLLHEIVFVLLLFSRISVFMFVFCCTVDAHAVYGFWNHFRRATKLPPVNDLHLRTHEHPARNAARGPSLPPTETQLPRSHRHHRSQQHATAADVVAALTSADQLTQPENTNTFFQRSQSSVRRHFWISPDWLSEGLTVRRLQLENRSDPMKYGWI